MRIVEFTPQLSIYLGVNESLNTCFGYRIADIDMLPGDRSIFASVKLPVTDL